MTLKHKKYQVKLMSYITIIFIPSHFLFSLVNNLESFLDMTTPKNEYGEIFSLMELVRRFYKPRQLS